MAEQPIPVLQSFLDPDALGRIVTSVYGIPVAACHLERSYVNDVYRIITPDATYFLKIYRAHRRLMEEIEYEMDVLEHLRVKHIPISLPVRRCDGVCVGTIHAPEGERVMVLYEQATGQKPQPPFTPPLYHEFGKATARLHQGLDDFTSTHWRRPLDMAYLLDEPLAAIYHFMQHRRSDWLDLQAIAHHIRTNILTLSSELDWGVCHGDVTLDNVHITVDHAFTFYDFDSGGPGWRAYEPAAIYAFQHSKQNGAWDAFLSGYTQIRPFSLANQLAVRYFVPAWWIWIMGYDATYLVRTRGNVAIDDSYLDDELHRLRSWATSEWDEPIPFFINEP